MTKEQILELKENHEVEFKKSNGRDGKGELPKDFWSTYSAMANSYGGTVFLGVKESQEKELEIVGIENISKVKKELFDLLNSKSKVNKNILSDVDILELNIEDKNILQINIPRATRKDKPIYIGQNPLQGTYKRDFEGDYRCDEECVKRMLAEQIEDTRDNNLLEGYNFVDLDVDTFYTYRKMFATNKREHPYNDLDDKNFLRSIGGWKIDRKTKEEGLTLAGLLMFGKLSSIQEELPYYMLDYQERPEAKTEYRWIDRLTIDGTWSGNLFDFYKKVIRKLYADLKVPFILNKDVRQDNSIVHIALREALINTIAHADYSGRTSLLVVKRPDMFGFRNPGLMRIPIENAIHGGESDCRNRTIHQMFLLVGLGERAGSGLPKIFSGWNSQHWSKPLLYEKSESEQTLLELRMINLFDDNVILSLKNQFGEMFNKLSETKIVILATAYLEKIINHSRVNEIVDEHSHDISIILKQLVDDEFLDSDGKSKGKVYFLPDTNLSKPQDFTFEAPDIRNGTPDIRKNIRPTGNEPVELPCSLDSQSKAPVISSKAPDIRNKTPDIIFTFEDLSKDEKGEYIIIAKEISQTVRAEKESVMKTIKLLCTKKYLSLDILSKLLNRSNDSLRKHYLNPMVKDNILKRAFPTKPNHPQQAYKYE